MFCTDPLHVHVHHGIRTSQHVVSCPASLSACDKEAGQETVQHEPRPQALISPDIPSIRQSTCKQVRALEVLLLF